MVEAESGDAEKPAEGKQAEGADDTDKKDKEEEADKKEDGGEKKE